jgi:4a-hydroxytetrahydrobiopterin dehydratase
MAVLSDEEVEQRLGELDDDWARKDDTIERTFKFDDFKGSIDFITRITPVAEDMNHHPDLSVSWNTVTVSLSTHSEGGITENDFELAGKIDELE